MTTTLSVSLPSFRSESSLLLKPCLRPNLLRFRSHQLNNKKTKNQISISSAQSSSFDLSPPPIDHDFLDTVKTTGAEVSGDGIIETFHNDEEALDAADNGVVVVDLSHFGRIRVSGDDRVQFLRNQSTANFESLQEGQGCDTVFVTPTARTIDIAHAWIMKNAITLVVSPETCRTITEMLNKYIFFADKVEIQDITKKTSLFVLVGPKSSQVMENLNLGDLVGKPYGTHQHFYRALEEKKLAQEEARNAERLAMHTFHEKTSLVEVLSKFHKYSNLIARVVEYGAKGCDH